MQNKEIYQDFCRYLDSLIGMNLDRQLHLENLKNEFFPAEFAMQFATVKFDIGRQIGKSEYIKTRAGESSLVVVSSQSEAEIIHEGANYDVLTADQLLKANCDDFPEYEFIYIEEPMFVFKQVSVETIYKKLAVNGPRQIFIFLGM